MQNYTIIYIEDVIILLKGQHCKNIIFPAYKPSRVFVEFLEVQWLKICQGFRVPGAKVFFGHKRQIGGRMLCEQKPCGASVIRGFPFKTSIPTENE